MYIYVYIYIYRERERERERQRGRCFFANTTRFNLIKQDCVTKSELAEDQSIIKQLIKVLVWLSWIEKMTC